MDHSFCATCERRDHNFCIHPSHQLLSCTFVLVCIRTWHWRFPPQCSHSVWLLAFGPYHTFFTQLAMHRITDLISPAHPIDIQFYFYHINFFLFKKGGKGSIIQGFTPHESKLRLTGEWNEVEGWKLSDKTKILR